MSGNMSIGMTAAFVAYTGMFATRAGGVINRVFEYRLQTGLPARSRAER
jgi:hypothetical protein